LPAYVPASGLGNVIIFAADDWLELPAEPDRNHADLAYVSSLRFYRDRAWDNRFAPETRNVPVLTDDLNPVDLWSEKTNLIARKDLHSYFEKSGKSW
jgi:hypothetical protein